MIKNILKILLSAACAILLTSLGVAAQAQTVAKPIIIVAPIAKLDSAQTIASFFEQNPDAGLTNTAIYEELAERGYPVVDFMREFMSRTSQNPQLLARNNIVQYMVAQTKSTIIIVPTEQRARSSRGNSLKLTLTAFRVDNGKKISSVNIFSGLYFTSDYVKLAIKALALLPEEDLKKFMDSLK